MKRADPKKAFSSIKRTPGAARRFLLLAVFLLSLPALSSIYDGYTGKLLISGNLLDEGIFHKSVVYVVKHDLFGAYGFIINKPLNGNSQSGSQPEKRHGGPVKPSEWQKVVTFGEEGLASLDNLPAEASDSEGEKFIVSGYAGWGPLQLNYEFLRGGWMVMDYDHSLVTGTDPENIWDKAIAKYRSMHPSRPGRKI